MGGGVGIQWGGGVLRYGGWGKKAAVSRQPSAVSFQLSAFSLQLFVLRLPAGNTGTRERNGGEQLPATASGSKLVALRRRLSSLR
jgi:hypothetical protein